MNHYELLSHCSIDAQLPHDQWCCPSFYGCKVASVLSDSVQPHRRWPARLPHPWDSPGKNTGVGCHFLLQCRKVKTESEVAQSCPTLSDPMDCSLPGSSVHGIFQARVLEWGADALFVFLGLMTICIPSFEKCLYKSFVNFKIELVLCCWVVT